MRKYVIKNRMYGKPLMGRTVFYQGFRKRPAFFKDKGQGFSNGKHLLETLDKKFKKYDLIVTPKTDRIETKGSKRRVFISEQTLRKIAAIVRTRGRDIKLDATIEVISQVFPTAFDVSQRVETYRRGMLSRLLSDQLDPRSLSAEDGKALSSFAAKMAANPKAAGFDEQATVQRKRDVQLLHLRRLIAEFDARLTKPLSESDWQAYFDEKILYFQDSYIRKIPKMNVALVTTQFPDFGVVTADDYLDLLEIKLPRTPLLNEDKSHNSYYWTSDIAKAIAQVETYIESVSSKKADLIVQIEKIASLRLRIVKPRGIIIAGSRSEFTGNQIKAEYFRMLNEGLKNVEIVPYDDLSRRLQNTLVSIERLAKPAVAMKKKR